MFGDLQTTEGLRKLNDYLSDRSYIEGYQKSEADTKVVQQLRTPPPSTYAHALRWYKHIKSHEHEIIGFPQSIESNELAEKRNKVDDDDDDDLGLFGSDDDMDEEIEKLKEERLKQYEEKKAKKPATVAKSSVVLDVKPWDDETNMQEMEKMVRSINCDGLTWGASKLVPLAFGIHKLQIVCIVEDLKVSIDWLQEEIQNFEDYVQSVDIAAFQKL
ncbi:elongation factor 1-beta-like [Centruroides vittatus]|uniref:elongation factor 1-beta-like n=1 Tax=Centruroides vittatus TaxID=120091 RepID=UPI00350FF5FB